MWPVDKTHPLHGVYIFKRGFGGRYVELIGEYDYYPIGLLRRIVPIGIGLYKHWRTKRS